MGRLTEYRWGFAGGKPQGAGVLKALRNAGFVPEFIAAPPDLPSADWAALERFANDCSVPAFTSKDLCEHAARVERLDLLLVCRFGLLPRTVFAAPRWGVVNIHSSLLPKYRGVHPVSWALINGESETGVTLHRIDDGIDTGEILVQRSTPIRAEDDIWGLSARLDALSGRLAVELFQEVARRGELPRGRPQEGEPSYAPRRKPQDGRIDWSRSARDLDNLVRSLKPPLPSPFCVNAEGELVEILSCTEARLPVGPSADAVPGAVIGETEDGHYIVKADDLAVILSTNRTLVQGEVLR